MAKRNNFTAKSNPLTAKPILAHGGSEFHGGSNCHGRNDSFDEVNVTQSLSLENGGPLSWFFLI